MSDTVDREFSLRRVARTAADTHDYIHEQGFLCHGCSHRHLGAPAGFICVGCACERRAPTVQDFDAARTINWRCLIEYGGPYERVQPERKEVH